MKKNFLNTLAAALLTGAVAVSGLTACSSSDDNILGEQPATEQPAAVKTYRVSIPASFGGDGAQTRAVSFDGTASTTTFTTSERVYVYNATTGEMMGGYLQPADISADGKSCNLTGTLTGTGTIESENELRLFYNLTNVVTDKDGDFYKYYTYFKYSDNHDGTPSGVTDGAEATVTVSSYNTGGMLTTTETARFENLQSMFRFKFIDENSNAISVKSLRIQSSNEALISYYRPLRTDAPNTMDDYTFTLGTATTDYIYVAMRIEESWSDDDELTFTVTDGEGNEYKGTKAAPAGGFKNGKYYYNSSAIQLTKQNLEKPTITWNSVDEYQDEEPDEYNRYNVYGPWNNETYNNDPSVITISGTSTGYYFSMKNGATIHLSSLTATYDESSEFIFSNSNLNLDISGANSITCKNRYQAIYVYGTLKLSGSGTLTVTSNYATLYGLYASTNYKDSNNSDSNNSDASVLAADGYTVTRSAVTNNVDGTYTWTYTVAPVAP